MGRGMTKFHSSCEYTHHWRKAVRWWPEWAGSFQGFGLYKGGHSALWKSVV